MGITPFAWKPEWDLGIASIDGQHKNILKAINALQDFKPEKTARHIQVRLINALQQYARVHFKYEESLLAKANYPQLAEQEQDHQDFVAAIEGFKYQLRNHPGTPEFQENLLVFLLQWLESHINQTDRKYQEHLLEAGVS